MSFSLDSTPYTLLVTFGLDGRRGASQSFISRFEKAIQLLEQGEIDDVQAVIETMERFSSKTIYETSRLSMLRAMVYTVAGSEFSR